MKTFDEVQQEECRAENATELKWAIEHGDEFCKYCNWEGETKDLLRETYIREVRDIVHLICPQCNEVLWFKFISKEEVG
jgi:hypothetical protein